MGLRAALIAVSIVLIAGACAVVLVAGFGASLSEAVAVVVAVTLGLAMLARGGEDRRTRREIEVRLDDLSRAQTEIARQTAEVARRMAHFEQIATDRARAAIDPIADEIATLGDLVRDIAEAVAEQDAAIAAAQARIASPAARPTPAAAAEATRPGEFVAEPGTKTEGLDPAVVRAAIEAGRIELYLQPIMTLPQRKVRWYEALSRLRTEDGTTLEPAAWLPVAEAAGLMPDLDARVLLRCGQVLRRLEAKNRDVGLFVNLSARSIADAGFARELTSFIDANKGLSNSLVFEISQRTLRTMGPIEQETLATMSEAGFRFSLDRVEDLRFEPRGLAERGIRYVKVPAEMMLQRAAAAGAEIHPADLADLFGRFGIEIIAERIESEGTVVDLLDFDVRYGQGFLFSTPRPVRAEVLAGIADARAAEPAAPPATPALPAQRPLRADRSERPAPEPEAAPVRRRMSDLAAIARTAIRRA